MGRFYAFWQHLDPQRRLHLVLLSICLVVSGAIGWTVANGISLSVRHDGAYVWIEAERQPTVVPSPLPITVDTDPPRLAETPTAQGSGIGAAIADFFGLEPGPPAPSFEPTSTISGGATPRSAERSAVAGPQASSTSSPRRTAIASAIEDLPDPPAVSRAVAPASPSGEAAPASPVPPTPGNSPTQTRTPSTIPSSDEDGERSGGGRQPGATATSQPGVDPVVIGEPVASAIPATSTAVNHSPTSQPANAPTATSQPPKGPPPTATSRPPVPRPSPTTEPPKPTKAPEPTKVPKPTKAPEPTEAPKPTRVPKPTREPDPTATAIPPTDVPPTDVPPKPTDVPPTDVPPKPTDVPPTDVPPQPTRRPDPTAEPTQPLEPTAEPTTVSEPTATPCPKGKGDGVDPTKKCKKP